MDKENAEGVDYFGPVKKIHKGFFLATLVKLIKKRLVGSHLVTKSTPRASGDKPIISIGHR